MKREMREILPPLAQTGIQSCRAAWSPRRDYLCAVRNDTGEPWMRMRPQSSGWSQMPEALWWKSLDLPKDPSLWHRQEYDPLVMVTKLQGHHGHVT